MNQNYSTDRAKKLLKIAQKLKDLLYIYEENSYIDKINIITLVSIHYLNILHTFKVDNKLWKKARKDVNIILKNVKDINQINICIQLLKNHLNEYIKILKTKWKNKNE